MRTVEAGAEEPHTVTCYYFWNIQLESRKPKQQNQEQS